MHTAVGRIRSRWPRSFVACLLIGGLALAWAPLVHAGFDDGQLFARVALNSIDNQYLIVYQDGTNPGGCCGPEEFVRGLTGTIVDAADGSEIVPPFTISSDLVLTTGQGFEDPNVTSVAFDRSNKRFLVAWTQFDSIDNSFQVVGRLIEADGTVSDDGVTDLDSSGGIDDLDAILIGDAEGFEDKLSAVVAADPINGRFLVVWSDDRSSDFEALGRMVNSADGSLHDGGVSDLDTSGGLDAVDAIEIAIGADKDRPTVAFSLADARYLVAWAEDFASSFVTVDPATGIGSKAAPLRTSDHEGYALDPDPDSNPGTDDAILYGVDGTSLYQIDRITGEATALFSMAPYTSLTALEFDPATGDLLATDINTGDFVSIDVGGATVTPIRFGHGSPNALAYDPNSGTLYGVDDTKDVLFSINPATGLTTEIGPLGTGFVTGLAYDHVNDILYAVDQTSIDRLMTINTSTGAATVVGTNLSCANSDDCRQVAGLAFNPDGNFDATADDPVLYTVNSWFGDQLIEIDPATGTGTNLGTLPTTNTTTSHPATDFESVLSLAFDPDPDDTPATADGTLYGVETNNDHLAVIDPQVLSNSAPVAVLTEGGVDFRGGVRGLAFSGHTLYGVDGDFDQLVSIDTSTAVTTLGGILGFQFARGLGLHPDTGALYAGDNARDRLLDVDPATGAASVVGALGFGNIGGMAFDPDPNGDGNPADAVLYATDLQTNTLYTVDTTTGAGTAVGAAGNLLLSGIQGIAFDPATDQLLGSSSTSSEELLARIISADGTLYDGDPAIPPDLTDPSEGLFVSIALGDQDFPAATYDSRDALFILVWRDLRDDEFDWDGDGMSDQDIAGQLLDGEGHLIDPTGGAGPDLTDPFVNVPVHTASPDQWYPAVSYSAGGGGRIWVSWTTDASPTKIEYASLSTSTLSVTAATDLTGGSVDDEDLSAAAASGFCGSTLFAYTVGAEAFGGVDASVGGSVVPGCAPDPGLLWPVVGVGTAPREIAPVSAETGETVTFAVEYHSDPASRAPQVAQLWIDLDGDGQYSASGPQERFDMQSDGSEASAGAVGAAGAAPGFGEVPPGAWPFAAMFGVLLPAGTWLVRRRVRPLLLVGCMLFGLALFTFVALSGCGGGSGGGDAGGGDPGGGSGSEEGDFTNGVLYTVDVPLAIGPGIVTYRFEFHDGVNQAAGDPTHETTLQITAP